jgi:hypothetical protein
MRARHLLHEPQPHEARHPMTKTAGSDGFATRLAIAAFKGAGAARSAISNLRSRGVDVGGAVLLYKDRVDRYGRKVSAVRGKGPVCAIVIPEYDRADGAGDGDHAG